MKKSMDLKKMKKPLIVKSHIKAGPSVLRYAVVVKPGQGNQNQNHTGG